MESFLGSGYPTKINIQHSINETEDEDESKLFHVSALG
jgi:hypothetical protein